MVRTTEREAFLARAGRLSTVPSAKRQRLCSDTDEETLPTPSGQSRSRFFEGAAAEASPSGHKLTRTKKSRKSNFGVFSDEIAEDIMCQLSEVPGPTDRGKITSTETMIATQDNVAASGTNCDGRTVTESQITKTTTSHNSLCASLESKPTITPAEDNALTTSVSADDDPKLFNRVLEAHVKKQNASLLTKYAFSGVAETSSSTTASNEEKPAPTANTPSISARSSTTCLGETLNRSASVRRRLTPLERLGQSALAKSRSMDNLGVRKMLGATNRDSGYESDFARDSSHETTPAPKNPHQGSEDQICPPSDEEADESCGQLATLDLQRFSFIPK
jgi:exonuclease-1